MASMAAGRVKLQGDGSIDIANPWEKAGAALAALNTIGRERRPIDAGAPC